MPLRSLVQMPTCPCWKLTDACSCCWSYCTLACWKVPVPEMVRINSLCWCLATSIIGTQGISSVLRTRRNSWPLSLASYIQQIFAAWCWGGSVEGADCPSGADISVFAFVVHCWFHIDGIWFHLLLLVLSVCFYRFSLISRLLKMITISYMF